MRKKYFIDNSNIDEFRIAYYQGESLNDSELVSIRNKKILNILYGKQAAQLYKLLIGDSHGKN